jgi:hypothetical protein
MQQIVEDLVNAIFSESYIFPDCRFPTDLIAIVTVILLGV